MSAVEALEIERIGDSVIIGIVSNGSTVSLTLTVPIAQQLGVALCQKTAFRGSDMLTDDNLHRFMEHGGSP